MMRRARGRRPQATPTFAVGEEAEQSGAGVIREVGKLAAPIDAAGAALRAGLTARVDVVVRTRKIGHFFPGGTVDAFDVWLELQGKDADGRVIFWSGRWTTTAKGRSSRARTSTAPTSSMAKATRSTSATPGRRAACCTCG